MHESLSLSANTNVCVCVCLRSCTRAKTKLPAGCLGLFVLERLHWFDCEHAWKSFHAVEIMTGPQRRRHVFIIGTDWLKRDTDTNF